MQTDAARSVETSVTAYQENTVIGTTECNSSIPSENIILNPRKSLNIAVFWDVTQCTVVEACRRFGRHYCLRYQDLLKRRGTYTVLHDETCQQTAVSTATTLGTSGIPGGAVGKGTALQVGRSWVRLPMVSLEFFIDIILPAALRPWGWHSLTEMSTGIFPGG